MLQATVQRFSRPIRTTHMIKISENVRLPAPESTTELLELRQLPGHFSADAFDQLFHRPPTNLGLRLPVGIHHLLIDTPHQVHRFMSLRCEQCFKLSYLLVRGQFQPDGQSSPALIKRVVFAAPPPVLLTLDPLPGFSRRARLRPRGSWHCSGAEARGLQWISGWIRACFAAAAEQQPDPSRGVPDANRRRAIHHASGRRCTGGKSTGSARRTRGPAG